jgi:hypothetical protein
VPFTNTNNFGQQPHSFVRPLARITSSEDVDIDHYQLDAPARATSLSDFNPPPHISAPISPRHHDGAASEEDASESEEDDDPAESVEGEQSHVEIEESTSSPHVATPDLSLEQDIPVNPADTNIGAVAVLASESAPAVDNPADTAPNDEAVLEPLDSESDPSSGAPTPESASNIDNSLAIPPPVNIDFSPTAPEVYDSWTAPLAVGKSHLYGHPQDMVRPENAGLLSLLSEIPGIMPQIVALLGKADREALQHANMAMFEVVEKQTWTIVPAKDGKMACTRRVPYFTATSLLQRRVSAFNGACDTPDRGLVKIIGYGIEHRCQFGEALYAGSHGSSEDVRNPGVFRMEFHGCVHLDWATLEQLPKQFPQLQHVGVYDCPLFDFSLLADPPAHNALPDDFKLDIGGDVSDDDSEVGPDDFGDAIIEEFHVRTIERKIDGR